MKHDTSSFKRFTDLTVWQEARLFKKAIQDLAGKFPQEERFRLSDQIIRSSRSVGANIAEGHGRFSYKEQLQFCMFSRGSLSEMLGHLYDALDANYMDQQEFARFEEQFRKVEALLNGYITFLRSKINTQND